MSGVTDEVRERARHVGKLLSVREKELAKQYRWKAENNIRFFDGLGMTTEQKVDFLAQEFARAHMAGELAALRERSRNENR